MRLIKATTTPATAIKIKNRVTMGSATDGVVDGVLSGGKHLSSSRQGLNTHLAMFDHETALVRFRSKFRSKFQFWLTKMAANSRPTGNESTGAMESSHSMLNKALTLNR